MGLDGEGERFGQVDLSLRMSDEVEGGDVRKEG